MKWIVMIVLLPVCVLGQVPSASTQEQQTKSQLEAFLKTEFKEVLPSTVRVMKFIERLSANPESYGKSQQSFVKQIFVKSHSRFLKSFQPDATFSQLFSNGNYNCLTATALIATTLKHFGYTFRMFETNHHIFILVNTDRGLTLLETTDPFTGFVTDPGAIEKKISAYKTTTEANTDARVIHFEFRTPLYKEVSLDNLVGLLHFNLSVNAYNTKKFVLATDHLELTTATYQSSRVIEFADVILLTLKALNTPDGSRLTERLNRIKKASQEALASSK
jgi:hypothetical protein